VISLRQLGGGPFDTLRKFGMPLLQGLKNKLSDIAGGVAHAVKEAGGASLRKIAQEMPNAAAAGVKKIIETGTENFIRKAAGLKRKASPSPLPTPKSKHRRRRRYKRSRIDDVLGNDSY